MEAVLDGQVESFMLLGTWVFKDKTLQVSFAVGRWDHLLTFSQCLLQLYTLTVCQAARYIFPVWFCMEVVSMAILIWPLDLNDSNLGFFFKLVVSDFIRSNLKTL